MGLARGTDTGASANAIGRGPETGSRLPAGILVHYGTVLGPRGETRSGRGCVLTNAPACVSVNAADEGPSVQATICPHPAVFAPTAGLPRLRRRGISLAELVIVMSIIVVLSILVLSVIASLRNQSRMIGCLHNLQSIHGAFTQYAINNNQRFPSSRQVAGRSWESLLSPYIGPIDAFKCPADTDVFPNVGSSYDWRDMPDDESSLAGKANTGPLRQDRILSFETLPGWHAKHRIAVVRLNGAASLMDENQCFNDLAAPVQIQASRGQ